MRQLLFSFLLLLSYYIVAQSDEDQIRNAMNIQEQCWNGGDIECFMQYYWNSEELVFIGASGLTYGWQTTLDNYKKRYPDLATMGILNFDLILFNKLGEGHYLVIGKWYLKRNKEIGNTGGHFSLVWKNIEGKWLIIADHSS